MLFRASTRGVHTALSRAAPLTKEKITKLPSGLIVASAEQLPRPPFIDRAHLVLMYRAGARYETKKQIGLSSLIRGEIFYGPTKIGNKRTQIPDELQIIPYLSPDYLGVRVSVPRGSSNLALEFLSNIASFKDCDLDVLPYPLVDWRPRSIPYIAASGFRRIAYRDGSLAHPVYSKFSVLLEKYSDDELRQFAARFMVSDRAIVYGVNVEHEKLCAFGEEHVVVNTDPTLNAPDSPYVGGEWRKRNINSDTSCVAIGGRGAMMGDVPALAVQAVLMTSLGSCEMNSNKLVEGSGAFARLGKHGSFVVSCHAQSFEGEGIVHASITASPLSIYHVVKDVARTIKTFRVGNIEVAKQRAKSMILRREALAHPSEVTIRRTRQIFAGVKPDSVLAAIDNVTASQVEAAAARVMSNFSIGAYGNIDNVPRRGHIFYDL